MQRIIYYLPVFLFVITSAFADDSYNLFGDAGQAYSIEINLGHPPQKLHVIVDTGSTTLAVASYLRQNNDKYFHSENSSSIYESGKESERHSVNAMILHDMPLYNMENHGYKCSKWCLHGYDVALVQAKYSQGMWVGQLVTDYIQFPSLPSVREVRGEIALITKSHMFFVNGSGWQGLLGLAYLPVGARGENVIVESWLDSLDHASSQPMSFQLKLCGARSAYNATHYGNFMMLDDQTKHSNQNPMFRTPILQKRWYEIGVLSVRVIYKETNKSNVSDSILDIARGKLRDPIEEMCQMLNEEKSIVDSGTTNIKLPDMLLRQVVDELKSIAQASDVLILDEFWYHSEAACWLEPQAWSLPWLAVDLLSLDSDSHYFTLELPPQNYMRVVTARNSSSGDGGTVSEFCYKLGLEAGGKDTVLGYTAMEGFEVLFNRTAGWIGWQTSNCGPGARVTGPHNSTASLLKRCNLSQPALDAAVSIRAAQWVLSVVSVVAAGVLVYLLAPCVKSMLMRRMPRSQQISLSQAALVEQESS